MVSMASATHIAGRMVVRRRQLGTGPRSYRIQMGLPKGVGGRHITPVGWCLADSLDQRQGRNRRMPCEARVPCRPTAFLRGRACVEKGLATSGAVNGDDGTTASLLLRGKGGLLEF